MIYVELLQCQVRFDNFTSINLIQIYADFWYSMQPVFFVVVVVVVFTKFPNILPGLAHLQSKN